MDMPTPCPECGEIVDLIDMKAIGNELYCEDCFFELENEEDAK